MAELDLAESIELARLLIRCNQPLELVLANSAIPEQYRNEVRRAVTPTTIEVPELAGRVGADSWVLRPFPFGWYYWQRLERYLRDAKGWPPEVVRSIDDWSLRILSRLPDPRERSFDARGLVVGYVQSGKTANYTAVAARAADAGYRLIIVLSGIHNALREQTQFRLDQELTGEVPSGEPSVGRPEHGRRWKRLTQAGRDFAGVLDAGMLQGDVPMLAVVKKHGGILRTLIDGLGAAGTDALAHIPTLVIDDEADQASVNTGDNRPPADADLEPDELEAVDEETAPSRINALIRELLSALPRRAYVAYTATPFANVLVDLTPDREVGAGLFPKDFVLQLPRPNGYTGTEELFGTAGGAGRDVLRVIPDEEAAQLRPSGRKKGRFRPSMTPSLARAIEDFLLAGAVRALRGDGDAPNTMLVHTTHLTVGQGLLTDVLREHLRAIRGEWEYGAQSELRSRLAARWTTDFSRALDNPGAPTPSFADLVPHLEGVIGRVQILELNSLTGEELDYRGGRQLQVIAVGGNRLSRGLTLEGLTVSYFLRASSMCDTLLQMARWYGYRRGYEDLMRLHTTADLASWFTELATVEAELRDEIVRMNEQDRRPVDMGVRVRSHSSMLVTSRLKMKYGTTIQVGYSGEHPQTIVFPLHDHALLARNAGRAADLLGAGAPSAVGAGVLVQGVPAEAVAGFVSSYEIAPETRSFDPDHLSAWIRRRADEGDLVEWAVYLDGRDDRSLGTATFGAHTVGMVQRTRLLGTSSIGTLIDPRHEGVDLPEGPEPFRRGRSFDAAAMRAARPRHRGLVLLYPISPASRPDGAKPGNRVPLYDEGVGRPEVVLGVALSLPVVGDDTATEYVVGRRWSRLTR